MLLAAVSCARSPEPFHAVGLWYGDFAPTTDEEVHDLLARAAEQHAPAPGQGEDPGAGNVSKEGAGEGSDAVGTDRGRGR